MKAVAMISMWLLLTWCNDGRADEQEESRTVCKIKSCLEQEVNDLTQTEAALRQRLAALAETIADQSQLLAEAERLAAEFRTAAQQEDSAFPVQLKGQSYSRERLLSQLRMLLVQVEGHKTTLARLVTVRNQGEAEAASLAVVINYQRAQGPALAIDELLLALRKRSTPALVALRQFDSEVVEKLQCEKGSHLFEVAQQLSGPAERQPRWIISDADVERFLQATVRRPGAPAPAPASPPPAELTAPGKTPSSAPSAKSWPCLKR